MNVSGAISGVSTAAQGSDTFTFTTPNNCNYVRFSWRNSNGDDVMFNLGGSFLPYEPYSSEVWHDIPHYIHNTSTDTITTLPAVLYPNDTTATVGLKGNMEQSGTPTPTNPIQPQETGDRTENLFDGSLIDGYFTSISFNTTGNESVFKSIKVLLPAGTYTFSWGKNVNVIRTIIDGVYAQSSYSNVSSYTFTSTTDGYVGVSFRDTTSSSTAWDITTPIMLNEGSTALPYEPYGYKIPISSNSTTTPVYLGETQSTRRIKRLVLTGEETGWGRTTTDRRIVYFLNTLTPDYLRSDDTTLLCSHYKAIAGVSTASNVGEGETSLLKTVGGNQRLYIGDSNYDTTDSFKAYLAAQYAAGTPVCVWYVLATPETAVVNEPIRKIDDYADEVSGITIPTIAGANTLSIGTTVQPSEVTVNYKGWHPVSDVHEKSKNLFDASIAIEDKQYDAKGALVNPTQAGKWWASNYIEVEYESTYIRSSNGIAVGNVYNLYDANKIFIEKLSPGTGIPFTISNNNAKYITFAINSDSTPLSTYQLNKGSTPQPYKPYWN